MEQLVEIVVREVAAELQRRGIVIETASGADAKPVIAQPNARRSATIDLAGYATPVLTERHVLALDASVEELMLPRGTIITPGAKDVIKRRGLVVSSDVKKR
jgi:hypothetical protein